MSAPSSHFERLSFWELLNRHAVQIPVIQRDYAQGRKTKTKVIDEFLGALRSAVIGDPIELDFIYGDVKDGFFRPLDGQQRLTTLFLLHWYAARAAGLSADVYAPILSRFSYDTRASSRRFCERMVQETVIVDGTSAQDSLSQRIRDYPWFVGAWEFDPTVAGMLAVLDKISSIKWPHDLWNRLTATGDSAPIRFLLVELEKFGLSDDLYIKMNARGKPLTPFEGFKALLGKRVVDECWEDDLSTKDRFAIRVDTRWTDVFWKLCPNEESGLKRIDAAFLSFIAHSLACSIARHTMVAETVADVLQRLLNDPEAMEPEDFKEPSSYSELRDRLELLSEKLGALLNEARLHWEFPDPSTPSHKSILEEVIQTSGPQYKRRLILYAQVRLHEAKASISPEEMADWRRVLRNVIARSVADRPENFVAEIRLIDELAEGTNSIYEFLACTKIQSRFASMQVAEEQRKARLLVHNPGQKRLLHRLEDTHFLLGRISFALDCVNNDPTSENFDFALLAEVASVIEREFGNGITPEIRRAFFTIGDGNFFCYWSSWFHTKNLPKYCLIENYNEFRSFTDPNLPSRGEALKAFVLKLIGKSCAQLIEEYEPAPDTPNWRVRLIRESNLIGRATAHFIALDKPGKIVYPIDGIRPHNNTKTLEYLEANKIQ